MTSNSTINVAGTLVKLALIDGRFDFEVLTPSGRPSELSAYGLQLEDAAHFILELPQMLAACTGAAATPRADMDVVRTLVEAGLPNARAAALAARPIQANKNQL